jgi:hypothetical protein
MNAFPFFIHNHQMLSIAYDASYFITLSRRNRYENYQSVIVLQLDGVDAQEAFEKVSVYLQSADHNIQKAYSHSS